VIKLFSAGTYHGFEIYYTRAGKWPCKIKGWYVQYYDKHGRDWPANAIPRFKTRDAMRARIRSIETKYPEKVKMLKGPE